MEKQRKTYQFKSSRIWKDSIAIGFAIFGGVSAITGILGVSFTDIFDNVLISLALTIGALLCSYLIAVVFLWWNIRVSITMKIKGIKVTIRQGDIFKQDGWKIIGVDDTFSSSENDAVISHSSLHGQLIKQLIENKELEEFKASIPHDNHNVSLGKIITYKDFMLLALTHLNNENEAHIDSLNYESIMRKMWQEIGCYYSGKPIYLPIVGDGITRFDGVSEKPSPFELLKCMLCTLKTSNAQINASVTIVIYDRMNEISLYNLKKFIT